MPWAVERNEWGPTPARGTREASEGQQVEITRFRCDDRRRRPFLRADRRIKARPGIAAVGPAAASRCGRTGRNASVERTPEIFGESQVDLEALHESIGSPKIATADAMDARGLEANRSRSMTDQASAAVVLNRYGNSTTWLLELTNLQLRLARRTDGEGYTDSSVLGRA